MTCDVAAGAGAEGLFQLTVPGDDLVTAVHQQHAERDEREHGYEKELHLQ